MGLLGSLQGGDEEEEEEDSIPADSEGTSAGTAGRSCQWARDREGPGGGAGAGGELRGLGRGIQEA